MYIHNIGIVIAQSDKQFVEGVLLLIILNQRPHGIHAIFKSYET